MLCYHDMSVLSLKIRTHIYAENSHRNNFVSPGNGESMG